jgi:hypothetical protein
MVFLLRININNCSYDVGVIVADGPEAAARTIGRKIQSRGAGPKGQSYFDLTCGTGVLPYFTMNSMPEISSVEQLKSFC